VPNVALAQSILKSPPALPGYLLGNLAGAGS
jgi:hypothetical protein